MAAESKHLLAYWYLAEMNYAGIGLKPSCQVAVSVSLRASGLMCLGRLHITIVHSFTSRLLSVVIGNYTPLKMLIMPIRTVI